MSWSGRVNALLTAQPAFANSVAMHPEIRARLFALSDLMQKEKDPQKLMQLVYEILGLLDRIQGHKLEEKPN